MRYPTLFLGLTLTAFATLPGCSDDDDDEQTGQLSSAQRAELDAQLAELKEKVRKLEVQAGATQTLQAEVEKAKTALKAVEDKLSTGDYAAVRAELDVAKKALSDLQAAWAALPGSLTLEAKFSVGAATDLQLDTPYELSSGKTFAFSEARYWLTNVKLTATGGGYTVPNAYYLVEVMKEQNLSNGATGTHKIPANRRETIVISGVPSGSYTGISFSVGVDATHNDNLSLGGGELHVLKNMTSDNGWMWFTSYIFSKVRGDFVEGSTAAVPVAWETGTNDDLRTVTKTFASPIKVGAGVTSKVNLRTDVKKLFTSLDPKTTPTIKAAQTTERTTLSNNWGTAFELVSATSQ